ncbi:hypothetical protein GCM10009755_25810 [Brevibacterium samyangense]|uniref:HTH tetR-type domain-containing protein n=1 Tax=Brevibacterium samyangense TaxID=366888 RepID=A0ABN2TM01_9MICO
MAAAPSRGPKREMSVERIVDTAIALADEEGLGAVSMTAVAKILGFTTMSLYRYVTSKDELLLLMEEEAIGDPPLTITEALTWQDSLRAWMRERAAALRAHPWLLDIPAAGTPLTPRALAWVDACLQGLRPSGLTPAEALATSALAAGLARVQVGIERSGAGLGSVAGSGAGAGGDADADLLRVVLDHFVTAESFPALAALADGVLGAESRRADMTFAVERLLDGIERFVAGRASGGVEGGTDGGIGNGTGGASGDDGSRTEGVVEGVDSPQAMASGEVIAAGDALERSPLAVGAHDAGDGDRTEDDWIRARPVGAPREGAGADPVSEGDVTSPARDEVEPSRAQGEKRDGRRAEKREEKAYATLYPKDARVKKVRAERRETEKRLRETRKELRDAERRLAAAEKKLEDAKKRERDAVERARSRELKES